MSTIFSIETGKARARAEKIHRRLNIFGDKRKLPQEGSCNQLTETDSPLCFPQDVCSVYEFQISTLYCSNSLALSLKEKKLLDLN